MKTRIPIAPQFQTSALQTALEMAERNATETLQTFEEQIKNDVERAIKEKRADLEAQKPKWFALWEDELNATLNTRIDQLVAQAQAEGSKLLPRELVAHMTVVANEQIEDAKKAFPAKAERGIEQELNVFRAGGKLYGVREPVQGVDVISAAQIAAKEAEIQQELDQHVKELLSAEERRQREKQKAEHAAAVKAERAQKAAQLQAAAAALLVDEQPVAPASQAPAREVTATASLTPPATGTEPAGHPLPSIMVATGPELFAMQTLPPKARAGHGPGQPAVDPLDAAGPTATSRHPTAHQRIMAPVQPRNTHDAEDDERPAGRFDQLTAIWYQHWLRPPIIILVATIIMIVVAKGLLAWRQASIQEATRQALETERSNHQRIEQVCEALIDQRLKDPKTGIEATAQKVLKSSWALGWFDINFRQSYDGEKHKDREAQRAEPRRAPRTSAPTVTPPTPRLRPLNWGDTSRRRPRKAPGPRR